MEPRLKQSTKWTPFPDELLQQIREVVGVFFADYDLEAEQFIIQGAIYPEEILLRIGVHKPGQLHQDNFEASLAYDQGKEKALDLIHLMTDFLGETWIHFLEDEPDSEDLPLSWQENSFEKRPLFLRYTSANSELEREADILLNSYDKKLVYGEDELVEEAAGDTDEDPEYKSSPSETPLH